MNEMSKPIFIDAEMNFSVFDQAALKKLILEVARPNCRMAEIGSWVGNGSTQTFLSAMKDFKGSKLYCVDTWAGSPNVDRHMDIAGRFDVFETFMTNTAWGREHVSLTPVVSDSAVAASDFADGFFDLVFIDADHSYDSVSKDIAAWRTKVRPNGILCGHDCEIRYAQWDRANLANGKNNDMAPLWSGRRVHAGVVLAVHEAFGGKANLCAKGRITADNGKRGYSTIWWVEGESWLTPHIGSPGEHPGIG